MLHWAVRVRSFVRSVVHSLTHKFQRSFLLLLLCSYLRKMFFLLAVCTNVGMLFFSFSMHSVFYAPFILQVYLKVRIYLM